MFTSNGDSYVVLFSNPFFVLQLLMSILYFFSKVSDKVSDVNLPDISIIKKLACEGTTRINEIFDISIWKRLRS